MINECFIVTRRQTNKLGNPLTVKQEYLAAIIFGVFFKNGKLANNKFGDLHHLIYLLKIEFFKLANKLLPIINCFTA